MRPRKIEAVRVFSLAVVLCPSMMLFAATKTVPIIPKPVQMSVQDGNFRLTPATVIVVDNTSALEVRQLSEMLSPATGFALEVRNSAAAGVPVIEIKLDSSLGKLGEEAYQLTVSPEMVSIRAPRSAGLFYGFQSLSQLLPLEIFRAARVARVEWTIPCVQIEDYPRFKWPGVLLDSARHFMPKESVKKFIDLLACTK